MLPERLDQRHLDPGPEASREGPPGAVGLTFPHEPRFVPTRRPEKRRREKPPGVIPKQPLGGLTCESGQRSQQRSCS